MTQFIHALNQLTWPCLIERKDMTTFLMKKIKKIIRVCWHNFCIWRLQRRANVVIAELKELPPSDYSWQYHKLSDELESLNQEIMERLTIVEGV